MTNTTEPWQEHFTQLYCLFFDLPLQTFLYSYDFLGLLFSPGTTPIKLDRHDITEILTEYKWR